MIAVVFRTQRKMDDQEYKMIAAPLMEKVVDYDGYSRSIMLPKDHLGWNTTIHYFNNRINLMNWVRSEDHQNVMKRSKEFYHDVEIIIGDVT